MCHLGHCHQPSLRWLPDKGVAPWQGRGDGRGRQAIQRIGDAGEQDGLLQNAVFIGLGHANPLIYHGCKGGLSRYSPPELPPAEPLKVPTI